MEVTPLVSDPDFTLHVGDVRDVLRELEPESVHCVVTSPPYWGLRDYGTGEWEGGDPECDHKMPATGGNPKQGANKGNNNLEAMPFKERCGKCGATRIDRQLGLEPTPEEYVANMVEVFREVRRVLRADGTCWVNLGDSYASSSTYNTSNTLHTEHGWKQDGDHRPNAGVPAGLKPKDLVGIPWRVAFALQADGWYLRSDIIWSKPNPMPESVTDRPTKAHEYMFLLTKSPRYFFDQEAVRKPHSPDGRLKTVHDHLTDQSHPNYDNVGNGNERWPNGGRNIRSVWEIPTQSYPEAHFATFPQALVEPCIKAGCPEGEIVLDPFLGSGTTALVARKLGRRCIGIELNPEYAELAAKRLNQLSLLA